MIELDEIQQQIRDFKNPRPFTHIVIHHSLTKDGQVNDWNAIRNYHTKTLGWDFVGYHAGLEIVDGVLGYQLGRGLDCVGAHTKGMNDKAIGICCVGNFDIVEPSKAHYFMLSNLVKALMGRFGIPIQNINPHWAYADKSCPGKKFDMLKLREWISGGISA
jgi:N-acetylmuramoyl-L-alanine amidase